jgi:membrane fusion protein (multidrug efflux system)
MLKQTLRVGTDIGSQFVSAIMEQSKPPQQPQADNAPPVSAAAPEKPSTVVVEDMPSRRMTQRRKRGLLIILFVVVIVGVLWALYEWLVLSHYQSTDNAYVQGNIVQITPQVGGTVTAIYADETNRVQAGQPLIKFDTADTAVALDQAEAALGQAVRQACSLFATNTVLNSQIKLREVDITKAQTQLDAAKQDLLRRQKLSSTGGVSGEELAHAKDQVTIANNLLLAAKTAVSAARDQLISNQVLTNGTSVDSHPNVKAAAARLKQAWLDAHRTTLPTPVSGYVSKRTVQLGQRVAPGAPLMSVVPLDQVWVDANFKENQLRDIRIGQPVKLTADVYGSKVVFDGKVIGLGIATGAASALLPAQNATGNWIKVVQRVPVRVALDSDQLKKHPLRVGLSMMVEVDVKDQSGPELVSAPPVEPVASTEVYADADQGADALVRRIIDRNRSCTYR